MAINKNISHRNLSIRVKYFDHAYEQDNSVLTDNNKIKGVFYAQIHSNITSYNYVTQSGIKSVKKEMSLYTEDFVTNLVADDFVLFNGERWLVTRVEQVPLKHQKARLISGYIIYMRL